MHKLKRGASVIGGTLALGTLLFSAAVDKFGYVGVATKLLPKPLVNFINTPDGVLCLLAMGVGLIWWAFRHPAEAEPDIAALHQANTKREMEIDAVRRQLGRRLSAEQKEIIRRALEPLTTQWNTAHPSVSSRLGICVYARPGSDTEDYAEDYADVIRSVSLKVGKFEFPSDSEFDGIERYGVWVRWNSQCEHLPIGQTLVDALRRCGVDVMPLDLPYASFVELIVYRRRPD